MPTNNNYINIFGTLVFNKAPLAHYNIDIMIFDCHSAGATSDEKGRLWFNRIPVCAIGNTYRLSIDDSEKEIDSDSFYNKRIPEHGNIGTIIIDSQSARQLSPITQDISTLIIEKTITETLEKHNPASIDPIEIKNLLISDLQEQLSVNSIHSDEPLSNVLQKYMKKTIIEKERQNNKIVLAITLLASGQPEHASELIYNEANLTEYALKKSLVQKSYNYNQVNLLQNKALSEYRWSTFINKELGNISMKKTGENKILELENINLE